MSDTISRQALLNKFEPWLKVKDYSDGELNMLKAILYEIRFTPPVGTNLAEVGTDCISRQSAIDALRDYLIEKRCPDDGTLTCRLIENEVINKLPSAQPKRGKWVEHKSTGYLMCDQCKDVYINPEWLADGHWNFCPNCGCTMNEDDTNERN